jgi:hypothetical protein
LPDNLERLYLVRAEIKGMARRLRVLGQLIARSIDEIEAATTDTNDSPGGHTHDDRSQDRRRGADQAG